MIKMTHSDASNRMLKSTVAVVIPAYRVRDHILNVISAIGPEVTRIFVVDDKCPEGSGRLAEEEAQDPRLKVLYNTENLGVGGAVMVGYREALSEGLDIAVKIDGDGQMDPSLISNFVGPIDRGMADYCKGNRFFSSAALSKMPLARLVGNAGLSFLTKASSGYWNLLDPTNGYTAIHLKVAATLEMSQISNRYFFESDLLFQLGKVRARVIDIPIVSLYGREESNLKISNVAFEFGYRNLRNTVKRIAYSYFVRNFSLASIALMSSIPLLVLGAGSALAIGVSANLSHVPASTGAIVTTALLLIFGFQLLLLFLAEDVASTPSVPIHLLLSDLPMVALRQNYPSRQISMLTSSVAPDQNSDASE